MQWVYEFDLSVFNAVFTNLSNDIMDFLMFWITKLGDGAIMPIFAVILMLFKKTRKAGMTMLGALAVMVVLNNLILKEVIARVRPCYLFDFAALEANFAEFELDEYNLIEKKVADMAKKFPELAAQWTQVYKFPEIEYTFFGDTVFAHHMPHSWSFPSGHTSSSFAFATAVFANNKKWGIGAYILAAVIGFSRIYLGVHYFTDVLAGAVLGVVYGAIGAFVIGALVKLIKKKNNKISKLF